MAKRASDPDEVSLTRGLVHVMLAMSATYTRVSRELGLTAQQAELLCVAQRGASVGEIAQVMSCDRSNVSRLLDRIARRGLVARRDTESDGRVRVVELSEEGQGLVDRFTAMLGSEIRSLLADWPAAEQRELGQKLNRMATVLDEANVPSPPRRPAPTVESALGAF
jgi:DNA-binding MarR family transcriptional regulator